MSSVENIQLMTIIETKMGQNGRRSKCATVYPIICVIYRDSNPIMIYIDCNRIKVSFIASNYKIYECRPFKLRNNLIIIRKNIKIWTAL